jgi:ubiquinone/menaquinone biosynthesis C-methylase UbiE
MTINAVFDKIAFQYDENRGGEARGREFAEHLAPFLRREDPVLDLGAGTGVVAAAVQAAGFDVVGLDNSSEMLKFAAPRVKHLVWSDMNKLPFIDRFFGTVYCIWAFHLVDNVSAALCEVRRVLKPGGAFLNCSAANGQISPPNDRAGQIVWEMQSALSGRELWRDNPDQLAAYAVSAGFSHERVVEIRHAYTTSAAKIALHLERAGMSTLQRATPDQQRDIVEPAIAALRALPNQDAPIERQRVHQLTILRAF